MVYLGDAVSMHSLLAMDATSAPFSSRTAVIFMLAAAHPLPACAPPAAPTDFALQHKCIVEKAVYPYVPSITAVSPHRRLLILYWQCPWWHHPSELYVQDGRGFANVKVAHAGAWRRFPSPWDNRNPEK